MIIRESVIYFFGTNISFFIQSSFILNLVHNLIIIKYTALPFEMQFEKNSIFLVISKNKYRLYIIHCYQVENKCNQTPL